MTTDAPTRTLPGVSQRRGEMSLEKIAALQACVLMVFATWAFGGNVTWAENVILAVGSLGGLVTLLELRRRLQARQSLKPFVVLVPVLAFALVESIAALRPNFTSMTIEGAQVFVPNAITTWLPSSARPELAVRGSLLFLAVFLPAYNLSVCVRSRRTLITLLTVCVANAVVLAVFGSLQKLAHAPGLYFGAVPSPNTRFFASFVYQNHWGAFAILMLATGWGLLFRGSDASRYRSFFQSPAFVGLVGLLLLTASAPLSASRSCTVMAGFLTVVVAAHGARRLANHGGASRRSRWIILLVVAITLLIAGAAVYELARPVMAARVADTRAQLTRMKESGSIGGRAELYRDTWKMAKDRLIFGWGLGSYPTVFMRYNQQVSVDRLPIYYEDAHSDWLQLLAEAGVFGMLCLGTAIGLPLSDLQRCGPLGVTPRYLLAGGGLILLYALVEFPFGNHAVVFCFWLCLFSGVRLAQLDARDRQS